MNHTVNEKVFLKLFRIIFVLFSLYLMGDAFSRWDGFSYYASFSEFLPGIALASILWSIVALLTSLTLLILFKGLEWSCNKAGCKIKIEHFIFFYIAAILSGTLVWKVKKIIWSDIETIFQIKLIALVLVIFASLFVSILFRDKAVKWVAIIQERINPLVWLFGFLIILSVPFIGYTSLIKDTGKNISERSNPAALINNNSPNIILVTFDALSARHMSVYGYEKNTTPFINSWAKKAILFNNAESESNFTTSATASLMTGKRVWTHQTFQIEGRPLKGDIESLPALLKARGYYNMAFVMNPHTSVDKLGMANSFDVAPIASDFSDPASLVGWQFGYLDILLYRIFGTRIKLYDWLLKKDFILRKLLIAISNDFTRTTVPPEKVLNGFLKKIDHTMQRPFFAWIHVFPPHDPYLPTEPFKYLFNSSDELRSFKKQEDIKMESYKFLFEYSQFPSEMQPMIDLFKDYYDEYISYDDKKFEEFIKALDKRSIPNTIIILSADHGESFEHGYFTHGGPFLYEQVTHIPFIIKEPGQITGQVLDRTVEQIDIPATILDLAGIDVPVWMEGRSLVPLMHGESLPGRPAFSMNFEENRSRGHQIEKGSIAVWDGDYKFIHYLQREESLLFNLREDPEELNNLYNQEPEIAQTLLRLTKESLKKVNSGEINNN